MISDESTAPQAHSFPFDEPSLSSSNSESNPLSHNSAKTAQARQSLAGSSLSFDDSVSTTVTPKSGVSTTPPIDTPVINGGSNKQSVTCRKRLKNREFRVRVLYMFLVSTVICLLSADQNLLAPSLTVVAAEFNLTAEEKDLYLGGYLSIVFFVSGGIAAIIAGYVADVYDRRLSFTVIVLIGEVSCLCTIFVTNFSGLLVSRMFTGISIGGSGPILFSMVGDTFIDEWRGRASSFLAIVAGAGVLVGQTIAALVAPTLGWRAPFAIVSVPAIMCTLIFYFIAPEPRRGSRERALKNLVKDSVITTSDLESYSEKMNWKKLFLLLRTKTVVFLLILSLPNSLPWGFLLVYAQDFLMHDVGKNISGGISSSESLAVVIIFSLAAAVGSIVGGLLTDYLWRRNPIYVCLASGITTSLGAVPMYFVANVSMTYVGYCLVVIPAGFLVSIGGTAKNAMLLNCTLPETRGTAFALNTLVDDLGKGLGSFLIAMMIVGLGGRVPAFNVAFSGWILAGVFFGLASCTIKSDLQRKNEQLIRAVRNSASSASMSVSPSGADIEAAEAKNARTIGDNSVEIAAV